MADAYSPELASFSFSDDEVAAIELALQQDHPWNEDSDELKGVKGYIKSAKDKIRQFHLERQGGCCCYCRNLLHGGGLYVVDREHIIPKGKFKSLSYSIGNLSVCCKRCNMEYKREGARFIVDPDSIEKGFEDSDRYLFIHPNYDFWEDFLERRVAQVNRYYLVKYRIVSDDPKAQYTYEFFNLNSLEVESFDVAQGRGELTDKEKERRHRMKEIFDSL